jgi:hypothetical protein
MHFGNIPGNLHEIGYLAAFRITTCAEIRDEYSNTILISNSLSNDDLICRKEWDSSKFRCSRASEKAIFFSGSESK